MNDLFFLKDCIPCRVRYTRNINKNECYGCSVYAITHYNMCGAGLSFIQAFFSSTLKGGNGTSWNTRTAWRWWWRLLIPTLYCSHPSAHQHMKPFLIYDLKGLCIHALKVSSSMYFHFYVRPKISSSSSRFLCVVSGIVQVDGVGREIFSLKQSCLVFLNSAEFVSILPAPFRILEVFLGDL